MFIEEYEPYVLQSTKFVNLTEFVLHFYLTYFRNPYHSGSTCITYDAVNAAYLDARKRISKFFLIRNYFFNFLKFFTLGVSHPKGDWKTEDIASVGELILDISIQIARQ